MWSYKELYSCPLPVLIGVFEYSGLLGYVVMPILNLRANLLITRNGEFKYYSNISTPSWREHVFKLCVAIASNKLNSLSTIDLAKAYSMFYGGIGSFIAYKSSLIPITIDFVNTEKYYFYLKPHSTLLSEHSTKGRLEEWVIFHSSLRSGEFDLLIESCRKLHSSSVEEASCTLTTDLGLLKITREKREYSDYIRVAPDNAPLRHVVSIVS
ncbi:MAG: hypothetical protein ACO2OR_02755 [Desulfurococcaceae archaeon]